MYLINKISEKDCAELSEILQPEFSYIDLSEKKICEKASKQNFFLIKCHQKNIILGFAEAEFFDIKARINAIFVEEAFRGQGVATKLLHKVFHECKRRRIHKIFLLVKEKNFPAKELYIKNGFEFAKMHTKELDSSRVEVWEKEVK